jgi:HPt (histidine-containing phosphotransfer) domain-containing protein
VDAEPIVVTIDRDLQDLVPLFIGQRKADQDALATALRMRDFEAVRKIGHGMAGAGSSYGFDCISEVGERLVIAARAADAPAVEAVCRTLDDFLRRLLVKYV